MRADVTGVSVEGGLPAETMLGQGFSHCDTSGNSLDGDMQFNTLWLSGSFPVLPQLDGAEMLKGTLPKVSVR